MMPGIALINRGENMKISRIRVNSGVLNTVYHLKKDSFGSIEPGCCDSNDCLMYGKFYRLKN